MGPNVLAKIHHDSGHHRTEVDRLKAELEQLTSRLAKLESEAAKNAEQKTAASDNNVPVYAGTKKLSLQLSGQMNRAAQLVDDGQRFRVKHVDNESDNSQVRVVANADLNSDFSAGAQWEINAQSNNSSLATIGENASADGGNTVATRKAEIMLTSKKFGKLSMGRGFLSSYGMSGEADLSGTGAVALSSNFTDLVGSYYFVNKATGTRTAGNNGAGIQVANVIDGMDGLIDNRVRYDTPQFFNVLSFSASHLGRSNDTFNFTARYAQEFSNKIKVSANAGYTQAHLANTSETLTTDSYKQYVGAAGILFPFGLNFHGVIGKRDFNQQNTKNGTMWVAKVGYILKKFKVGQTAFALDYGQFNDLLPVLEGSGEKYRARGYGAFIVQSFDDISTDLYVGVRRYRLKANQVSTSTGTVDGKYKEITTALLGGRVIF
ncbi:MAG: hypothetical protein ACK50V_06595 [Alphaproteobacteria bacterium]|nr:hypothetical protein [Alphaproteobacteria bacterium]